MSETGHVPLLHRTYPGNGSDQTVLGECLDALGKLHDALQDSDVRVRPGCRTLVRDGGSWSEQLELDLDVAGYYTLISLPLSHTASQLALEQAARRGAMKKPCRITCTIFGAISPASLPSGRFSDWSPICFSQAVS